MNEFHWLIVSLIVFILWLMGMIRLIPGSENKAKKELAKIIIKTNKGVYK